MIDTQFNLTNDPDSHCLAVYEDKNTKLTERSLIVSPILRRDYDYPYIIVKLEPEGFNKEVLLRDIKAIIITKIQWLQTDKEVNKQRLSV